MASEARTTLRVAAGGRIVIPAEVRRQLGMEVGSEIVLAIENDHATLTSARSSRRRARERVRRYVAPDARLSDELLAERRREAKRD